MKQKEFEPISERQAMMMLYVAEVSFGKETKNQGIKDLWPFLVATHYKTMLSWKKEGLVK